VAGGWHELMVPRRLILHGLVQRSAANPSKTYAIIHHFPPVSACGRIYMVAWKEVEHTTHLT